MVPRAVGAHGAPYLAQIGAKVLCLLEETLGKVVTVEALHMVAMVVMEASKTATKNGVGHAI